MRARPDKPVGFAQPNIIAVLVQTALPANLDGNFDRKMLFAWLRWRMRDRYHRDFAGFTGSQYDGARTVLVAF